MHDVGAAFAHGARKYDGVLAPSNLLPTPSVAEIRTINGFSRGQTLRTAAITSSGYAATAIAAVGVGAMIRQRREKLVNEIAVRAV